MTALMLSVEQQTEFFSKLSHIQDAVVAGKHPRFKLSNAALNELSRLRNGINGDVSLPLPASERLPAKEKVVQPSEARPASQGSAAAQLHDRQVHPPPHVASIVPQSSTFDPILLTKSDGLVRAEVALKRQRLERSVKDVAEASGGRLPDRQEIDVWEGPNTFDAVELLSTVIAAQNTIPAQIPETNNLDSNNSSFDENSYYSSKANSWSSGSSGLEEGEWEPEARAEKGALTHKGLSPQKQKTCIDDSKKNGTQKTVEACTSRSVQSNARNADAISMSSLTRPATGRNDAGREESYSPPPAGNRAQPSRNVPARLEDVAPRGPRAMQGHSKPLAATTRRVLTRESESYSPPSPAVPIIRSNLAAPVAPQPSRVSPFTSQYSILQSSGTSLAMPARAPQPPTQAPPVTLPKVANNRNNVQSKNLPATNGVKGLTKKQKQQEARNAIREQQHQQQQKQAAINAQNIPQARKRRAENNVEENNAGRREPHKRPGPTAQRSPEPYIKQELVSPPQLTAPLPPPPQRAPFQAPLQMPSDRREPPRRLVLRDDGRAEIQFSSPQDFGNARSQAAPQYTDANGLPSPYRPHGAYAVGESRIQSPTPLRRPPVEHHELRRVASMQYASQISPSHEPPRVPLEDVRYVRAPSRQIAEYEEPSYQPIIRYQQPNGYGSPFHHPSEFSAEATYDRTAMPPPPKKRIIVLENGEEWIAVPNPSPLRQSVAMEAPPPTPRIRYVEDGSRQQPYPVAAPRFLERPAHPQFRQQPQVIDLEAEDDYQRMPPPPISRQRDGVDDQLRYAMDYQNQHRARAISLQAPPSAGPLPAPPLRQERYEQVPAPFPPAAHNQPQYVERAYSAHPQLHQQPHVYAQNGGYGHQYGFGGQQRPQDVQMW